MSRNDSAEGDDGSLLSDDLDGMFEFPWLRGILAGVAAWVVGYVLFAVLFYLGPASIDAPSQSSRLTQIGHLFYNAQFVDRIVTAPGGIVIAGGRRTNFLLEASVTELPLAVYFAVPIVALVAAGVLFGALSLDPSPDFLESGLTGFAMALGYVVVAVAGTFLFVVTAAEGQVTAAPDRLQAAAFAFAYPFVLGTLGSLVGSLYDRE
ncbi:hypothetical protein [Halorhabdus amylolytica]|uniref:hypothetical protein n=1 Tax=Halorhabdus amylolytica TaxID=2559573 RepID=UPI0010AA1B49|nr:hypothetical protein [Halorhabdus amylolytica]